MSDLNWHRPIAPLPQPWPWRRLAFAVGFTAAVIVATIGVTYFLMVV